MENVVKNLKTFFGFAARKKGRYWVFVGVTALASLLTYSLPYFFKIFTDQLLAFNLTALYKTLFALIIVRLLGMLAKNLSFYLGDRNSIIGAMTARQEIFKKVQDLDFAFHSGKSTGYLISAFKRGDGAFWTLYFNIHHRL